jgi:hypothetical protein
MENPEKATAVLRQLADSGAGLALDDFGTGYSSLSYLNQFTFDTIKIDRSFLHAGENGTGSVILRSVVALAHELGKKVVVEGVETEDDVSLLRLIGCEYGQGFFYGEPMMEREVVQLLKVVRRAERRMTRKSGLLRARSRPAEAPPPATPAAATPARNGRAEPRRRTSPPQPVPNGAMPPQVPLAASTPAPEAARAPGGPPPLPGRPSAEAVIGGNGAHLGTLPPTPLRPGVQPDLASVRPGHTETNGAHEPPAVAPGSAGPPPLPSGPSPPPLPLRREEPPAVAAKSATLPPAIAESLARLASGPPGQETSEADRRRR